MYKREKILIYVNYFSMIAFSFFAEKKNTYNVIIFSEYNVF
jgi:hypothetical protein